MKTLTVSETFYSIQGEGPTAGTPAVFLRLKGCNLTCGGLNTIQTKSLDNGATWRCDTTEVWLKGHALTYEVLKEKWQKCGAWNGLLKGAHLVITGGEPLMHQENLVEFMQWLKEEVTPFPYIEIETNGTTLPKKALERYVSQYNVSPKLENSGMFLSRRVNKEVIHYFDHSQKAIFKFVVENKDDVEEIVATYAIKRDKLFLMPAADTREAYINKSPDVAALCKHYGCYFSSRLQLLLWDKATGV